MILDSPGPSTPDKDCLLPPDPQEIRRREHHEADIVIVGAGIVGCAAAVAFGKQGRSVILLERNLKEPDRIVGELLQPGGVRALQKLGLGDCLEDIDAIRVTGYGVYYHGEPVDIPYTDWTNPKTGKKEQAEGRSFHHGRFVQKLREAAMKAPNVTVVESKVTDLVRDGWTGQVLGVECMTRDEKDYYFGHLTLVADGYASKFRTSAKLRATPNTRSKFYGLELKDCPLPMQYHGHVILSHTAPVLLYQIGTRDTRILVDVPEGLEAAKTDKGGVKGYFRNVVTGVLPEPLRDSWIEALDKGHIRSMPNSFLPASTNKVPGMIIIGDAMNMRHPLTGGGMTVGLSDVVLVSELLSPQSVPRLEDTKLVLKQMSAFHWQRKMHSSVINILAMALYSLFAANGKASTLCLEIVFF